MKHRTIAPALGALAALILAAGVPSYASAADPSGIWAKDDGSAKMEVKKCGRGICSKIVWLRDPNDSRGRPLHDARNENVSMRDRPIIGLSLFSNMVPTEANAWVGNVYNPEEGKIYTSVKVTLVSHNQIVLKGCKAWLLCGEKTWLRSKLLPTETSPEEPIEVKAPAEPAEPAAPETPIEVKAPAEQAQPATPVVEAAGEPVVEPPAPKPTPAPLAETASSEARTIEAGVSVAPPRQPGLVSAASSHHNAVGLGLVTTAISHPEPLPLSGENVSSMMVMTRPAPIPDTPESRANEARVESAAVEDDQRAPAPAPKPKAKPRTLSADASESADAGEVPHVVRPKPVAKPKPKEPEEVLPWLRPR
jgi:uncharacterized protein (DUF2147 family)